VDHSALPCDADGQEYSVVGALVAPADHMPSSVTLYLHGSGDGATWHFRHPGADDHVTEMARLGHASVFVDQLGYGASDIPDGTKVCVGSMADMAGQMADALRAGSYVADGIAAPSFDRVALAGHSLGGAIAELAAFSFPDRFDAIVLAGWVSSITPQTSAAGQSGQAAAGPGALRGIAAGCSMPGPKREGAATGYATVFTADEIHRLFFDASDEVKDAMANAYEADACGAARSLGNEIVVAQVGTSSITAPVLIVLGEHDISGPSGAETERARMTGSDDVSMFIVPRTAHMMMLERSAAAFRATLSGWLAARGI
jgi:pimeloyl-ACP methyl ester carboxylesterase